jgi:hypothetical protein
MGGQGEIGMGKSEDDFRSRTGPHYDDLPPDFNGRLS